MFKNSFFKKFKKIKLLILNFIIIIFSSIFICQSDKVQEKISPNRYWQGKINSLKTELKKDSLKIEVLKLDLEKELALSIYNEKQAQIQAKQNNEDTSNTYLKIENEHIKKLKEIKNEIAQVNLEKEKVKTNLEKAYCQLSFLKNNKNIIIK